MIVITLAGKGSRFATAGFRSDKYMLPTKGGQTIIAQIVDSFSKSEKFLFVLNKDHGNKINLDGILRERLEDYRIIEVSDTDGQLTTVKLALQRTMDWWRNDEHLWIFNGDTLRYSGIPSDIWKRFDNSEGLIEVFRKEGTHWSFVDKLGKVSKVTEKVKISNLCSTGLYGFKSIDVFIRYALRSEMRLGEHYIAPLYNQLISEERNVYSFEVNSSLLEVVGTPAEYNRYLDLK